jgi:hypothetical protein
MGLAEQWQRILTGLPEGWTHVELRLRVREAAKLSRAAALLGPLNPGRVGNEIRFGISRASGVGPEPTRRLLKRLDAERIGGVLSITWHPVRAAAVEAAAERSLVSGWDDLVAGLPEDWSDLLCRLELDSSDDLPRATLLAAPLNPSRPEKDVGFDFRVARTFGYGTSPQMTRRCLGRLDEVGIPGDVALLRALSDTFPVATQGPVWYVDGKVL